MTSTPISDLPRILKRGLLRPATAREARRAARRPEWRGIVFRSKTEVQYAQYLDALHALYIIAAWKYEPVQLDIGAGRKYRIDFEVTTNDGRRVLVEVKGFKRVGQRKVYHDSQTRLRFALAREKHGGRYEFRYVRAVGGGRFEEVLVK